VPTLRRSIVLSGFMATGKSTVGPRLAARLGVPFVDTDVELAAAAQVAQVADLWNRLGEVEFRAREAALAERLLGDGTPRVVAFGGGLVTVRRTRHLALERAFVVTLTAPAETVVARVGDLTLRPNLAVGGDPVARAAQLLEARREAYAECHLAVGTDSRDAESVVEIILAAAARDPVAVPLGSRTYAVTVARDAPALVTEVVATLAPSSLVVVTDGNVERARGAVLRAALAPLRLRETHVTLTSGEEHKTLASASIVWDAALGAGLDRAALVVAFGGGVVGDLAGFAASALLRGVRVLQLPTTLLAMVDASVGGKTAVDHAAGKNLIGAFHQPSAVIADVAHLTTLEARELRAGLAEVVKIAVAADAPLLTLVEERAAALAAGDADALVEVVRAAVAAKVRIVRDDERETGARALLNLGHTVGHALEAHGGYTRWRHGEAVAIGTIAEMAATAAMGLTPPALVARTGALLERLGLPVSVGAQELAASWPRVGADKKRSKDDVVLPVVTGPGVSHLARVPLAELRARVLAPA